MPTPRTIFLPEGSKHGRLTIIKEISKTSKHVRRVECLCDCGNTVVVALHNIRHGNVSSCGCFAIDSNINRAKHGGYKDPEYNIWSRMLYRCHNENSSDWPRYGGRGITVCGAWRESYGNFIHDVGRRPSPLHTLDRINNELGYFPENVRWASKSQQARNRRSSVYITFGGQRRLMIDVCEELGMPYKIIKSRHTSGVPESSLFNPIAHRNRRR